MMNRSYRLTAKDLDRKVAAEIGNHVQDVKSVREDRSRELADSATAVHSLETHLSGTHLMSTRASQQRAVLE